VKFKQWLNKESVVGTAVLHGGIGESPGQNLNTPNMPVRSKISTNDGSSPPKDELKFKKPERIFGFKKERNQEREAQLIDRSTRFPVVRFQPSSIGFGQ